MAWTTAGKNARADATAGLRAVEERVDAVIKDAES